MAVFIGRFSVNNTIGKFRLRCKWYTLSEINGTSGKVVLFLRWKICWWKGGVLSMTLSYKHAENSADGSGSSKSLEGWELGSNRTCLFFPSKFPESFGKYGMSIVSWIMVFHPDTIVRPKSLIDIPKRDYDHRPLSWLCFIQQESKHKTKKPTNER